jgi:hypothetical protein
VSNRQWSASNASAEPADSHPTYPPALQGLNLRFVQPLQGWWQKVCLEPPVSLATLAPPTVIHIAPLRGKAEGEEVFFFAVSRLRVKWFSDV